MSDIKNIVITDIAEFDSVDVVEILVKAGDEVAIDQPLITIESEKAMMDYPSPLAGVVEQVIVKDGGKIKEGDTLITLKVASSQNSLQDSNISKQQAAAESQKDNNANLNPSINNQPTGKAREVSEEVKTISITDIAEFDSVDVVEVLVKKGDEVEVNQPLVTIESEKAMMDYPSPHAGIVQEVIVQDGGKIKEGDALISLKVVTDSVASQTENLSNSSHESSEHAEQSVANQSSINQASDKTTVTSSVSSQVSGQASGHVSGQASDQASSDKASGQVSGTTAYASPASNKYARELGVNLDNVQGSGRNRRIIKEDIQQHVREGLQSTRIAGAKPAKALDFSKYGESTAKELTKIQKLTANNMLNAWQSIPHVTHFDQADVTQLELHRKQLANELADKKIKLTPLVFVAKALVAALKKFPQFNSSLDSVSETLIYKDFFHLGIAVDTEYGLFVPVLRDVNKKSIEQLAVELIEISNLAKQRKLTPKHMGGASMTISSLGNLGGKYFTPIINPPEVAILGLSKMMVKDEILASRIEQHKLLPLSLSYDHRVINGADAARFCTYLKSVLEDIWKLIL